MSTISSISTNHSFFEVLGSLIKDFVSDKKLSLMKKVSGFIPFIIYSGIQLHCGKNKFDFTLPKTEKKDVLNAVKQAKSFFASEIKNELKEKKEEKHCFVNKHIAFRDNSKKSQTWNKLNSKLCDLQKSHDSEIHYLEDESPDYYTVEYEAKFIEVFFKTRIITEKEENEFLYLKPWDCEIEDQVPDLSVNPKFDGPKRIGKRAYRQIVLSQERKDSMSNKVEEVKKVFKAYYQGTKEYRAKVIADFIW